MLKENYFNIQFPFNTDGQWQPEHISRLTDLSRVNTCLSHLYQFSHQILSSCSLFSL